MKRVVESPVGHFSVWPFMRPFLLKTPFSLLALLLHDDDGSFTFLMMLPLLHSFLT